MKRDTAQSLFNWITSKPKAKNMTIECETITDIDGVEHDYWTVGADHDHFCFAIPKERQRTDK